MKKQLYTLLFAGLLATALILFVSAGERNSEDGSINYTNPGELLSLVENQKEPYILIDVRTEQEYENGHIPTAGNIPFDIIADKVPTETRDDLIILYCRSGRRSSIAAETLKKRGYTNVVDFGGVTNWPGELNY